MIPTELQSLLKARVEELFEGKLYNSPSNERVPLKVFEQQLPNKKSNDETHYPYIIVSLNYGEQKTIEDYQKAPVLFIIAIYEEDPDNQGHKEVLSIANDLLKNFMEYPILDKQFEFGFPVRWGLHEEDMAPYYYGALETQWTLPKIQRVDLEGLI